ncbi:hypothetical protein, partial [Bacillus sp. JJ722]|uniref:hypothetical protein n=1 Tax=Bacillus sp. JJ722 TaxID=3122973 RepID=UPI003000D034
NENITVYLNERNNYVLIEIVFGDNFYITGMTNKKTGGLEAFMEHYSKNGEYRIHLGCIESKEVFEIPLNNVNVELLEKN